MQSLQTDIQELLIVAQMVSALYQYITSLPTDPAARLAALSATAQQIDTVLTPVSGSGQGAQASAVGARKLN